MTRPNEMIVEVGNGSSYERTCQTAGLQWCFQFEPYIQVEPSLLILNMYEQNYETHQFQILKHIKNRTHLRILDVLFQFSHDFLAPISLKLYKLFIFVRHEYKDLLRSHAVVFFRKGLKKQYEVPESQPSSDRAVRQSCCLLLKMNLCQITNLRIIFCYYIHNYLTMFKKLVKISQNTPSNSHYHGYLTNIAFKFS